MAARTGAQYIAGPRERTAEVVIAGERVEDVTTHPALRNGVETLASLLDLQHDPALREEMTYVSPTSGEWVGLSFPHAPNRQGPGAAAYDDGPLG